MIVVVLLLFLLNMGSDSVWLRLVVKLMFFYVWNVLGVRLSLCIYVLRLYGCVMLMLVRCVCLWLGSRVCIVLML